MKYKNLKSFIDKIVGVTVLICLVPLFIPLIVLLKFSAEGEIFYLQERIGHQGEKFKIWKFATMVKNSLNMGNGAITLKNDPRVTRPGKFLRKSKLNELPQIINIIKGDISFVGPRPLVENIYLSYPEKTKKEIYKIKPGLTGIGSIVFRDEESLISAINEENPHEVYKRVISPFKGELELWYQKNQSFILDLQLIFLTAWVILFPKSRLYEKWLKDLPKREF